MPHQNFLNILDGHLDKHIYRIMKQEYIFKMFEDNQNVLSQTHNWKDKFENFLLSGIMTLDGENTTYGFKNDWIGQCWTNDGFSEAMWGIYANDSHQRYLRIRSTPRKLLTGLEAAHSDRPRQDTCFLGKVEYKTEKSLEEFLNNNGCLELSPKHFAESLLLKRRAFRHENEVRLLFFGDAEDYDCKGLYRYPVDPHGMITQIMADPNIKPTCWRNEKATIMQATGFKGEIKRSKIYDPPNWGSPTYNSVA